MRFLLALLVFLMPLPLWANCGGVDMRPVMNADQNAEVAQRLGGKPFPNGNHWLAMKGSKRINLIGTMHIDDPRFVPVVERLAPVIQAADLLLVEATTEDQKALEKNMATDPSLAFLTGKTLIDLMPPKEWEALAAAANARGIPPFMAAKFQPWYLSLILSMSPCALREAASGSEGLDAKLLGIAADANVPTASLEHYTTVFKLFGDDPIEKQIEMLSVGILPEDLSENATATLAAQYFDEEHLSALETSRVITRPVVKMDPADFDVVFDGLMDLLVRGRNESWIAPIEAAAGDNIVVAAGALHLGGEYGLLNLLQQRGYTLERLPF